MQDGQAFGAKDKRVPSFAIRFGSAEPGSTTSKRTWLSVDGQFSADHAQARSKASIDTSKQRVVYQRIFYPAKGSSSFEYGATVESLVKAATGGRVIVALTVEWK